MPPPRASERRGVPRAEIAMLAAAWVTPRGIELVGIPSGASDVTRRALTAVKAGGATTATLRDAGLTSDDITSVMAEVHKGPLRYEAAVTGFTAATGEPADLDQSIRHRASKHHPAPGGLLALGGLHPVGCIAESWRATRTWARRWSR